VVKRKDPYKEVSMDDSGRDHDGHKGIGERFQEETKYTPETIGGHALDWEHMPAPYKSYQGQSRPFHCPLPHPQGRPMSGM
jgi:hypothetical protein